MRNGQTELDAIEELEGLKVLLRALEGGETIVWDGIDCTQKTIESLRQSVAMLEEIVSKFPKEPHA